MCRSSTDPPRPWAKRLSRLPVVLFDLGLGRLMGGRLLLLRHTGRSSGLLRKTVLEVVASESEPRVWYVVAAWGKRADWVQNLAAHPDAEVVIGLRPVGVTAEVLAPELGQGVFDAYRRDHPVSWRMLARLLGIDGDREDSMDLAGRMPVIALRASPARVETESRGGPHDVARVFTTRAETQAIYDRIAPWYEPLEGVWERPARHRGLRALQAAPGETVLEIGPGPGSSLVALTRAVQPSGHVVGLDLSDAMCRRSRARLEKADALGAAAVVQGDGAALPFPDGAFDVCFMSFTLELFDTPEIAVVLGEVNRVLGEGGRLGVVSLSAAGHGSRMRRIYLWGHRTWPRLLDCRPIVADADIRDAGFRVVTSEHRSLWGLPLDIVVSIKDLSRPGSVRT